jgi:hypothetical protein
MELTSVANASDGNWVERQAPSFSLLVRQQAWTLFDFFRSYQAGTAIIRPGCQGLWTYSLAKANHIIAEELH